MCKLHWEFFQVHYGLNNRNNQQNANDAPQGDAAAGQNAVQAQPGNAAAGEGGPALGFQPYIRPPVFTVKVK